MHEKTLALLGVCSAIINIIGVIPYVRSILKGKTKPERSSWWIWTLLMVVALWAQAAVNINWSLMLTGSFLACNIVIAWLSLKHGYGKFKTYDLLAICLALAGIVIWKQTGRPILALIIIIFIDFMGNLLTMEKSWRAPYTEKLITWVAGCVASFIGVLAVGSWDAAKLIFPVYAVLVNVIMIGLLDYRRRWRRQRIRAGMTAGSK